MLKLKVPILKKARVGGGECKVFPLKVKTLAVHCAPRLMPKFLDFKDNINILLI